MLRIASRSFIAIVVPLLAIPGPGSAGQACAQCDTLGGPVVQDARRALESGDIAPVLKWVRAAAGRAYVSAGAR